MELADTALPGKIAEAANIMAVDAARGTPAHRTRRRSGASVDGYNDAIMGDTDLINGEAGREQRQQRFGHGKTKQSQRDTVSSMCSRLTYGASKLHRERGRTSFSCRLTGYTDRNGFAGFREAGLSAKL